MPLPLGLKQITPRGGAPIDIGVERERRIMRLRKAGDRRAMFLAETRTGVRREVETRIFRVEPN